MLLKYYRLTKILLPTEYYLPSTIMGSRRSSRLKAGDGSFENAFGQPTNEDRINSQRNSVFESSESIDAARSEVAEAVEERTRRVTRNGDGHVYVNTRAGISLGSVAMDAAGRQGAQQTLTAILDTPEIDDTNQQDLAKALEELDETGVAAATLEEEQEELSSTSTAEFIRAVHEEESKFVEDEELFFAALQQEQDIMRRDDVSNWFDANDDEWEQVIAAQEQAMRQNPILVEEMVDAIVGGSTRQSYFDDNMCCSQSLVSLRLTFPHNVPACGSIRQSPQPFQ